MKHTTIHTPSDFQNFKLQLFDFSAGWTKEYDKNQIQIFSKKVYYYYYHTIINIQKTPKSSIHCVKLIAHCNGVSAHQLFAALCDDVYMSKLDPHVIEWKVVDRIDAQNYVSYCMDFVTTNNSL